MIQLSFLRMCEKATKFTKRALHNQATLQGKLTCTHEKEGK
jgi:hypothetical protein